MTPLPPPAGAYSVNVPMRGNSGISKIKHSSGRHRAGTLVVYHLHAENGHKSVMTVGDFNFGFTKGCNLRIIRELEVKQF